MGTTEDMLKELILSNYKSIREFTIDVDMPYSTVDSIFKRGILKASVDNVIKICDKLNISADSLANGVVEPKVSDSITIAAHFDGTEYTEEQLDRIKEFAKFIKQENK